jgi:DNA polymerase I
MIYFVTNRTDNLVEECDGIEILYELRADLLSSTFYKSNFIGLDLETTGLRFNKDEILLIILGNDVDQVVIDWYSFKDSTDLSSFFNPKLLYIGHNLLFDLPFLMHRGVTFDNNQIYDTMIAEQVLIKGTKKSASLKATLERRLKVTDVDKNIRMEFVAMKKHVPMFDNRHIKYAASDIKYLYNIRIKQLQFLHKYNQTKLTDLNNKNVVISSKMKVCGMQLDKEKWMGLYKPMTEYCDQLELKMDKQLEAVGLKQYKKRRKVRNEQHDMFGGFSKEVVNKNVKNINYASPKQVLEIFKLLELPIPKSAKEDKNSIGEATLQQYLIKYPDSILHEFLITLIEYKISIKLSKSFGKKWVEENLDENERVHPTFKVNSTATGRFSCADPNLQQIPSNVNYRQCFVAPKGRKLWTCDYSSAELRILASLSRDQTMLNILSSGGDLHGYAATPIYRYLYKDTKAIVDKHNHGEFRSRMKNVIFGLLYGAGVGKIAELLDIDSYKAQKSYDILVKTFPDAFDYLEKMSRFGVMNGYIVVDEKLYQRRWFEEFFDGSGYLNKRERSMIERRSKNTPIQATNGQMMKLALVYVDDYITKNKLGSRIVSTVHDEMVVEVGEGEEGHVETFKYLMKVAGDEFLDGVEMDVEDKLLEYWSK